MSQVPVDDLTMRGYQAPRVVQFNVFLDNRVGKLLEVVDLIEGNGMSVAGLSVIDSNDYAVIRLIASRADVARKLLRKAGLSFSETEVIVVQLRPQQTLGGFCRTLLAAELNILYAYPLIVLPHGRPALAVHTEDQTLTSALLHRKQFVLLGEAELGAPGEPPAGPDAEGP